MTKPRYTLEWESEEICQIAENGNYMGTEEVVERLNQYESLMKELTSNGDFRELTGLMHDNNLNWKSVTNIIKEALDESI